MPHTPTYCRYPCELAHEISSSSPLSAWATHDGLLADADAEVVVVVRATSYALGTVAMKSRVYSVLGGWRGWIRSLCMAGC